MTIKKLIKGIEYQHSVKLGIICVKYSIYKKLSCGIFEIKGREYNLKYDIRSDENEVYLRNYCCAGNERFI